MGMSGWRILPVFLLLVTVSALSACTDAPDALPVATSQATATGPVSPDGRDLATQLLATDLLPGPEWHLGHLFRYHVFFSPKDAEGYHWESVIVEDRGDTWFLAPTDSLTARYESMFDFAVLGEFAKADLTTSANGQPFYWYEFPLTDKKTWERPLKYVDPLSGADFEYDITFEAAYNPSISTPLGPRPGFDVKATTSDGHLFLLYDYVPAIKWLAHYYEFDVTQNITDPMSQWAFHITTMGVEMDYTGDYYWSTANEVALISRDQYVYFDQERPQDVTQSHVPAEAPHYTFPVGSGPTWLHVFYWSYAYVGAQNTTLIDPANQIHGSQSVSVGLDTFDSDFWEFSVPAVPGEWKVESVGAGVAAGGGAWAFEITETKKTFGGGDHGGHLG